MSIEGLSKSDKPTEVKQPFTPEFKAFLEKALGFPTTEERFKNLLKMIGESKLSQRNYLANSTFGTGDKKVRLAQASLSLAGYDLGKYGVRGVDGKPGDLTCKAIKDFQQTIGLKPTGNLDPTTMDALEFITKKGFIRSQIELFGKEVRQTDKFKSLNDFSTKETTKKTIKNECIKQGLNLPAQIAYILATVQLETAGTFKPVIEAFWKSEEWRKENLRYYPYYGRGYVQITWQNNYDVYSKKTGKDLVNNPDFALEPETALFILVNGFKTGAFTGKKITDYINSTKTDFVGARYCINGTDRAKEIAKIAEVYLNLIKNGQL